MTKILVMGDRLAGTIDLLRENAPWASFVKAVDSREALQVGEGAEIILGHITSNLIDELDSVRWVQVTSAGVDYLPLEELQKKGISLTNVRGMHGDTIGDHVMAFILAWIRDLKRHFRRQREHLWNRNVRIRELAGMTIGVVGLGGIGSAVVRRAASFGMTVLGARRAPRPHPGVKEVYSSSDLDEMLTECDFLVLACPLTPETEGLIGKEELRMLPRGAYLVNIARGAVVDEDALIAALKSGHLGGAGLDVFAEEPLPEDSPLWDMSEVIITPHVAGHQTDYTEKAVRMFLENLKRYRDGEELKWKVNYRIGY